MQEVVEINLIQLLKLDLNVNEYLTLLKLHLMAKDEKLPFSSSEVFITSLITKGYLSNKDNSISFTTKGVSVFKKIDKSISEDEFDELFFLYPYKTPSGRILRNANKDFGNKRTRDYTNMFNKYKSKIKSIEEHNEVIKGTKNMINDYKRRGSSNFMKQLEVYINQNEWEKFISDNQTDFMGENIERL